MSENYVKLDELSFDDEFKNALGEMEQRIFESYYEFMPPKTDDWRTQAGVPSMYEEFCNGIGYDTGGKKYLRVVSGAFDEGQTSVWGFIALSDFKVKNKKKTGGDFIEFKEGDLLKSAGWSTPALNAPRGNIFKEDYKINWTGPNYL